MSGARRNFVGQRYPGGKGGPHPSPGRLPCLAPGCRRTIAKARLDADHDEWICSEHWKLVPRKWKRLRARARRRRDLKVERQVWRKVRALVIAETFMGVGM